MISILGYSKFDIDNIICQIFIKWWIFYALAWGGVNFFGHAWGEKIILLGDTVGGEYVKNSFVRVPLSYSNNLIWRKMTWWSAVCDM